MKHEECFLIDLQPRRKKLLAAVKTLECISKRFLYCFVYTSLLAQLNDHYSAGEMRIKPAIKTAITKAIIQIMNMVIAPTSRHWIKSYATS